MNSPSVRVRRATVEDLATLRSIWVSMRHSPENLEARLTEFQVVERDGDVVGCIGFQFVRTAALLHSEGYSDFSVADRARPLFWERLQTLAANHGIFRLWLQEYAPFWLETGFQPADEEALARLPEEWKTTEGKWYTLELKNEAVITAALKTQFAEFMATEKQSAEDTKARARMLSNLIIVACFIFFFLCLGVAFWLYTQPRR
jgi:N-acetylglutamate synthase-like GNAT family acetyltransferase